MDESGGFEEYGLILKMINGTYYERIGVYHRTDDPAWDEGFSRQTIRII